MGWSLGRFLAWHDTKEIHQMYTAYMCIEHGADKPKKVNAEVVNSKPLKYVQGRGYVSG